ncbi:NAD(P)-binding protein [Macrolepiota fuliginosa MF-IS2]|uniref:NAD(P)-binding protein n=1 Tax=Macrolepiota fuliginosa MF-IS2 TaxID=1400762 RepID=A0A9P5X512_9AGAR|nr:NAD(P)-binding protein [Macrolepiota fuliginosa MF-IS2]
MVSLRNIPPIGYTTQNILMSLGTVATSVSALLFTSTVLLPLSVLRMCLPASYLCRPQPSRNVVLIIGASRGIGFEVLKKYSTMPDTTIIAASSSIKNLRDAASSLGSPAATIELQQLDLKKTPTSINKAIREWDTAFGPITHLYAISGISNHLDDNKPWGLDVTDDIIRVNITGTVSAVLSAYELMKERSYGKICIVGSVAGFSSPANMISYASSKAFINNFGTDLRCLGSSVGVDVVTVAPGFIRTRMTDKMRSQDSSAPGFEFESPEGMATAMVNGVEKGGIGLVSWPWRQAIATYSLQGLNPLCDTLGRWVTYKAKMSGKKIT